MNGRCRSVADTLPWAFVEVLAEHGHLDLLRREADDGDYVCADAAARLMRARGEPAEAALALLRPFVDTEWVARAVDHISEILVDEGDDDAAMVMLRPLADEGQLEAVERLGTLLVRRGRGDDVLAMLRQALADVLYPIDVVVEVARELGRDEEVIGLLRSAIDGGRRGIECLLASELERAGRVDEAVAVLWECLTDGPYSVEDAEQLADLLARHDPPALVALTTGHLRMHAAQRLARLFEEQGRIDDAVTLLTAGSARLRRRRERDRARFPAATWRLPYVVANAVERNDTRLLADVLARHGRVEEAIAVLRPAASADPDLVRPLCVLLIGQDRPDEARAVAAEVADGWPGSDPVRLEWIEALVECGHPERAIAELRAEGIGRERLAGLLIASGAPDEAVAVLDPATDHLLLAEALVHAGRPEDAIATMRAAPIEVV